MAIVNVGQAAAILTQQAQPTRTDVLWGFIINPTFPEIVEIRYYDDLSMTWIPLTDSTRQYWLRAVIADNVTTPPISPNEGDRYIIPAGATGVWSTNVDKIAEYRSAAWVYEIPLDGYITNVIGEVNKLRQYEGVFATGAWVTLDFTLPFDPNDFVLEATRDQALGFPGLDTSGFLNPTVIDPDTIPYNPASVPSWPVGTDTVSEALDHLILSGGGGGTGVSFVADITARDAISTPAAGQFAYVTDATDDTEVSFGAAMYVWDTISWKVTYGDDLLIDDDRDTGISSTAANLMEAKVAGTDRWRWEGTEYGAIAADGPRLSIAPAAGDAHYTFTGDLDTGIRHEGADSIAVYTGGTPAITFDSVQNVTLANAPTADLHAATKLYVDAIASGLDLKVDVRASSTADIDLTTGTLLTIDGVVLIAGDRVLAKDQSLGQENGIYTAAVGSWTRATDADISAEVTSGMYCYTREGTASAGISYVLTTNDPIVLDTTVLVFGVYSIVNPTLGALLDVDLTGAAQGDLLVRGVTNWEDTAGELTWDATNKQLNILSTVSVENIGLTVRGEWDTSSTRQIRIERSRAGGANLNTSDFVGSWETLGQVNGALEFLTEMRTRVTDVTAAYDSQFQIQTAVAGTLQTGIELDSTAITFFDDGGSTPLLTLDRDAVSGSRVLIDQTPAAGGADDVLTWNITAGELRKVTQASIAALAASLSNISDDTGNNLLIGDAGDAGTVIDITAQGTAGNIGVTINTAGEGAFKVASGVATMLNITQSATDTSWFQMWGDNSATQKTLEVLGVSGNLDLRLIPKGTGTVVTSAAHTTNIAAADDVITKGYADTNYGGDVATDVIWDAAGDLAVGSGADTAVKLIKGTANQFLKVNAGATNIAYEALDISLDTSPTLGGTVNGGANIMQGMGSIRADNANGPWFLNEAASATNPTLVPDRTDTNTGIGHDNADQLMLIAGSRRILSVNGDTATAGNLGIVFQATPDYNAGDGVVFIAHAVTNPDGTAVSNGGIFYVDIADGNLHYVNTGGTDFDLTDTGGTPVGSANVIQASDGAAGHRALEGGVNAGLINIENAADDVIEGLILQRTKITTAAGDGLGFRTTWQLQDDAVLPGVLRDAAYMDVEWADVTGDDAKFTLSLRVLDINVQNVLTIDNSIDAIGFGRNNSATGTDSVHIGGGGFAAGASSISMGNAAEVAAAGSNAIAIGTDAGDIDAGTYGVSAISIGSGANSTGGRNIGNNSIALGINTLSETVNSIAIGNGAGNGSSAATQGAWIAIGLNAGGGATPPGNADVMIGEDANATANRGVAIGVDALSSADSAIAIGDNADATFLEAISIGNNSNALGLQAIAIGDGAQATNSSAIAIGEDAIAPNPEAIAIGHAAEANATDAIAIGGAAGVNGIGADGSSSISIGANANSVDTQNIGQNSIAIGNSAESISDNSIAIGTTAETAIGPAIAIGNQAQATGDSAIAIGDLSDATQTRSIAIGDTALATGGTSSLAIGNGAQATGSSDNIAIGIGAIANANGAIAIGPATGINGAGADGAGSVSIGADSNSVDTQAIGQDSVAIGADSASIGADSIAIGGCTATAPDSIAIGRLATTGATSGGISIGTGADANPTSGNNAIAIGTGAEAHTDSSIAIGVNAGQASGTPQNLYISIGWQSNSNAAANIGEDAIGIGTDVESSGNQSIAIGDIAMAQSTGSIAIGDAAVASASGSDNIAIGTGTTITGTAAGAIAIGDTATTSAGSAVVIGASATSAGGSSVAIGPGATVASGSSSGIAIGNLTDADGIGDIVIGDVAQGTGTGDRRIVIGDNAVITASGDYNIAIGADISIGSTAADAIAIGRGGTGIGIRAIAIGLNATASQDGIGIGQDADAGNTDAIAIGNGASNTSGSIGSRSLSLGYNANAGIHNIGDHTIAIGFQADTEGVDSIAIGHVALAAADNSLAIGENTEATVAGAMMLGYKLSGNITNDRTDSFALGWDETGPAMWIENYTGTTTDATANVIIGTIPLDASSTYSVHVNIIGGETDASATEFRNSVFIGTYKRLGAGDPILIGATTKLHDVNDGTTGAPNLNINTTSDSLEVRVTGTATTVMNWRAVVHLSKVASATS